MKSISSPLIVSLMALAVAACQPPEPEKAAHAPPVPHRPAAPVGPTAPISAAETVQAFRAAWDQAPPAKRPAPEESGGGAFTFSGGQLTRWAVTVTP